MDKKERRVKILQIPQDLILVILNWCRDPQRCLALPVLDELPEDIEIISVHANWPCRAIDLMITHPSFDIVPNGSEPPRIPGLLSGLRVVSPLMRKEHR